MRPRPLPSRRAAGAPLRALLALLCLCGPAQAFSPVGKQEAADLVGRCLPAVMEARAVSTLGLDRAEGALPDAVREARGGEVWESPFGGILLHQAGPLDCTVIVPGADPRGFAFWVERWSNGPVGRAWVGKWFGRLDSVAWRRFRRRGGSPVRVHAVTGADRAASEMRVMGRMGGR